LVACVRVFVHACTESQGIRPPHCEWPALFVYPLLVRFVCSPPFLGGCRSLFGLWSREALMGEGLSLWDAPTPHQTTATSPGGLRAGWVGDSTCPIPMGMALTRSIRISAPVRRLLLVCVLAKLREDADRPVPHHAGLRMACRAPCCCMAPCCRCREAPAG
jgi:hypothetical protein